MFKTSVKWRHESRRVCVCMWVGDCTETGSTFGELALLNDDCIRNASVVAVERTDLMLISRALYSRCLSGWQAAEWQAKIDFVSRHPLFTHWPVKQRRSLAMCLTKETRQFGDYIVRQQNTLQSIFIIAKYVVQHN